MSDFAIERLSVPLCDADARELAQLLVDAVDSGGAVSFVAPLAIDTAEQWWREATAKAHERAVFLVARDASGVAGCVQLHPSWAPNQPHRADVAKLLVHRRARRRGLGARLMAGIEDAARAAGLRLLTLDTKRGDGAEPLYRKMGWIEAGIIPRYALDSDGTPHDTVIFYKEL